jgi:hypothetical protein
MLKALLWSVVLAIVISVALPSGSAEARRRPRRTTTTTVQPAPSTTTTVAPTTTTTVPPTTTTTVPPATTTAPTYGAALPIVYDINDVTGTRLHVSPNGSNTTGTGSASAPFKTVGRAVAAVSGPTTILVAGGTYDLAAEAKTTTYAEWSKSGHRITIKALPGQVPVFDGSKPAGAGVVEGALVHVPYNTVPAGLGAGLALTSLPKATFSGSTPTGLAARVGWRCVSGYYHTTPAPTSSNPSGCAAGTAHVISAYYPDQAWAAGTRLVQVLDKSLVTPGTFYVERSSSTDTTSIATRLYVHGSVDLATLRVSDNKYDIRVGHPDITIEGIKIVRNSPGRGTAGYSTLYLTNNADRAVLRDVVVEDSANIGATLAGAHTDPVTDATVDRVSMLNPGWSGITSLYSDRLTIKKSDVGWSNRDREYLASPQSGGIKFSRVFDSKVLDSWLHHNDAHGIWYDQQGYKAEIARNLFEANVVSDLYFEISHGLLFRDNTVNSTAAVAVRTSGSSGIELVGNTISGGGAGLAVYTDNRSKKYDSDGNGTADRFCAENAARYGGTFHSQCGGMSSDLNRLHLGQFGSTNETPGLTWMPGVKTLTGNTFRAQSTAGGHSNCTTDAVAVCVLAFLDAGGIKVDPPSIFTGATIDGNTYPTGRIFHVRTTTGQTCGVNASTIEQLRTAFAGSCYGMNVEQNGRVGA